MQAIISDIHGNLPALKAVLDDIAHLDIDELICLGDVVGYGPWPNECLDLLHECDALVLGNHEEAMMNGSLSAGFNDKARRAIDWTRTEVLDNTNGHLPEYVEQQKQFLSTFTRQHEGSSLQYVHASPRDPTREYVTPRDSMNRRKMTGIFDAMEWVCFAGHTHLPGVFIPGEFSTPDELLGKIYLLEPDEKALINVGSVGQPRDGDPRACYVMFDGDSVRWRRVEYDVDAVVQRIAEIPALDAYLGERLRQGR